ILISFSIILISSFIQNLRHITPINQYLMLFLFTMGYGICFDCYRVISIHLIGFVPEFVDKFNYIAKVALIFFSVLVVFQIVVFLNQLSGHKIKKGFLIEKINFIYFFLSGFFSLINMFYIYKISPNELGFYTYQIDFSEYLIIFFFVIFFAIYLIYNTIIFLKEIKKRRLLIIMSLFSFNFCSLIIERFVIIGIYAVFPNTVELFTFDIFILALIMGFSACFTLIIPDYLESISAYFSVKSLYLVRNNGQLIYEIDFTKEYYFEPFSSKKLLLGGFIYSIKYGLEDSFILGKTVNSIDFGDLKLLFKPGKYVFGVLFVSEQTPLIQEKLTKFIDLFESNYKIDLENWSGNVGKFETEEMKNLIFRIFK
ncbi:MAG: hypothetical protein ACFFCM_05965, partial [Promethearchaeota archaeon]